METYIKLIDDIDDELAELKPNWVTGSQDIIFKSIQNFIYKRLGEEYAHCNVTVKEYPSNTANAVKVTIHNPEYSSLYTAIVGGDMLAD